MRLARVIAIFMIFVGPAAFVLTSMEPTSLQPGDGDYRPFRFESFEQAFSCGEADVNRAKDAFLKHFPIGTSIQPVRDFFHFLGGECFMRKVDWGDDLVCTYAHMVVPLFMATGWVVIISPG